MKNNLKLEKFFSALQIPLCGSQHGLVNSYCSTSEATELREQATRQEQASIWLEWYFAKLTPFFCVLLSAAEITMVFFFCFVQSEFQRRCYK